MMGATKIATRRYPRHSLESTSSTPSWAVACFLITLSFVTKRCLALTAAPVTYNAKPQAVLSPMSVSRSVPPFRGVLAYVSHPFLLHHRYIARNSVTLHSSSSSISIDVDDISNPFSKIRGKTLLSVQECISVSNFYRDSLQKHANDNENSQNKIPPQKLVFVDGSWYHRPDPITNLFRNPSLEFQTGPRLPNARYLDMDAIASSQELFPERNPKGLMHMMPTGRLFRLAMDAFGISGGAGSGMDDQVDHVIIYAKRGALFTPRIWFLFVSMGHDPDRVHLMQGSLEDWIEEGGEVEDFSLLGSEDGEREGTVGYGFERFFDQGILNVTRLFHEYYHTEEVQTRYRSSVEEALNICGKQDVLNAVNAFLEQGESKRNGDGLVDDNTIIIDTRGSGYKRKGHMPSAIHLPYSQLASADNPLVLRPKEELRKLFIERGIDVMNPKQKIILSCGSGVSVCHGYLAMKILGREMTEENTRIYDGSWMEWGRDDEDNPKIFPTI